MYVSRDRLRAQAQYATLEGQAHCHALLEGGTKCHTQVPHSTHPSPRLTRRRHGVGLACRGALRPQLAQRVLKHGGEVEAVGGLVAAGSQPLLLQRLQRRVRHQHGLAVAGAALAAVC